MTLLIFKMSNRLNRNNKISNQLKVKRIKKFKHKPILLSYPIKIKIISNHKIKTKSSIKIV